jgi:uncharacterized protein with GYD domain
MRAESLSLFFRKERAVATFFMFGKYTKEALEKVSGERTKQAHKLIEKYGGQVKAIYALLGEHDLAIIAELPCMTDAMRASIALKRATDISFFTTAALPVEEFDKLAGEV